MGQALNVLPGILGGPVTSPMMNQGPAPASEFPMQDMGALPEGPTYPHVQPGEQVGAQGMAQPPQMGIQPRTDPGFGDRANAAQGQQGGQQGWMSDAGMWGLLSAGLGILANNYGNYGQASPAIGKGGLIGVQTFLGQRQQGIENKRRDELAAADAAWRQSQANYNDRSLGLQERRIDREERAEREAAQQREMRAALAVSLAGGDTEQQKIAASNPDEFLKFRLGQLKPEYRERSVKEGSTAFDEYSTDGGKTWDKVPGGGRYDLRAAKGGSDINVNQTAKTTDNFNEQSAKDQAKSLIDTFNTLQTIPSQLIAMGEAEKALAGAGGFVGSGAETKLAIAKFFNNNFGTEIAPDQVANAELLRSTLFRQIMENLKKLDAQPSQQQQKVMQESLGSLGTDPNAIPQIIRITREVLSSRAKEHNRRVGQATKNGAVFLYDITIPEFDSTPQELAPVDKGKPGVADGTRKTLGGKTYIKRNGQWFEE